MARKIASLGELRADLLRLRDGYEVPAYRWEAMDGPSGGDVAPAAIFLHGIQSHPGWFLGAGEFLRSNGWQVVLVTRRGSGTCTQDRGHARSARQLLEDVDAACRWARKACRTDRLCGIGVSWGGKLLSTYASQRGGASLLRSLVLVAPGICPRVDVSAWTKLQIAASLILGGRRRFDIPLNEPELFTDTPRFRAYLRDDPHRLHRATARLLYVSRKLDGMLRRAPRGVIRSPITCLLAKEDKIIDNEATWLRVERLTAGRARRVDMAGAHTLEFEEDPSPYYAALLQAVSCPSTPV